jgi:molybdopterin-containing oxidoreductase family iron-sulfur binding subunit
MNDPRAKGEAEAPVDLAALRRKLGGQRGPAFWRSLEELAESPAFEAHLAAELPAAAPLFGTVDRRRFLKLMGASLALAGASACTRQPEEKIFPYVKQPEEIVPGEPLFFATAMPLGSGATGVLVESHMGRPTKIEGNPEHPASLGATDALAQASVLGLYDPDRSQVLTYAGEIRPWPAFLAAMREVRLKHLGDRGGGLRILTETVTSPTLSGQLRALGAEFPEARWHQFEPLTRDAVRAGARRAFGRVVEPRYRFERAGVILSLDADFLSIGPGRIRYTRDFSRRRRPENGGNRLYAVEPSPSITGAVADHRLPLGAALVQEFAVALAARLGLAVRAPAGMEAHAEWIAALARDLEQHRGAGLVVAGELQPEPVHLLAHAINDRLGNAGKTVVYTEPVEAEPIDQTASLAELAADLDAGRVETLLVLGANPVATAPADLDFAARLRKVGLAVHLGLYADETGWLCHWHVPEAHYLEAWSDVRAFDGSASIIQPLIAPLYDGRTAHEVLAALSARPGRSSHDLVREHWQAARPGADFEAFWRRAVHDGVVPGTELEPLSVRFRADWQSAIPAAPGEREGLEIVFRPDPSLYDGRFANNAWLQELPRPGTRLTWDNAALIGPATAERLGLASEDVVELGIGDRSVRAPVWILPGHAPDSVTVHLGHGRSRAGRVASGSGFDAYRLRTTAAPWHARGLEIHPTGERHALACTQHHHAMEGREPVRVETLDEVRRRAHSPAEGLHGGHGEPSLYAAHPYPGHAWGMTIDLGACVGCNACVVACQAENNIAVVGKEEVAIGREMHWIRVDRYFAGDLDDPAILHQPVPCMQCEDAPCEVVCPVHATVHSDEGLNDMVYNRCVGTRYCSNNCPYKVRRFNFRLYQDWTTETLKMQRNPDVTVRSRGVMEKCTYCVQRINQARIVARREGREIRDGDVATACQAVCPAGAIVFGDVNDPESRVSRQKKDPRNYALLAELGTRPRTTYLSVVRNPNPEIERLGRKA